MSYFDHFAESESTSVGSFLQRKTMKTEYSMITKYLTADKNISILEIGPGQGILASMFLKSGYRNYDIVEPNQTLRQKLIRQGVRKAKNYMIPLLQEKNASYDAIIAMDVFEHLNDSREAMLFISDAARVLKKQGLLIILSPDLNDWKQDFYNCDFSHSNPTTVRRTMQLFYNSGIKTLTYKYIYCCFTGLLGYLVSRPIKCLTMFSFGNSQNSRIYKLRLNFLRRFIIIGRKL
jgi:SAM-dependent methyltransferase